MLNDSGIPLYMGLVTRLWSLTSGQQSLFEQNCSAMPKFGTGLVQCRTTYETVIEKSRKMFLKNEWSFKSNNFQGSFFQIFTFRVVDGCNIC